MSLLGETFLDLLEQDSIWRSADGRVMALESMEPSHRAAVLRMLVRLGPELYADWLNEQRIDDWLETADSGQAVGFNDEDPEDALSWLEHRPLVIRLCELSHTRSARPPNDRGHPARQTIRHVL
jgi:hypothetical protein